MGASSDPTPVKPRTKPTTNRRRREWREGGRSEERRAATHAPDSEPARHVTEAASLRIGGTWAAKLLPSIAFDLRREPTAGKRQGGFGGGGAGNLPPLPNIHPGPESGGARREARVEALTGEHIG